MAVTKMFCTCFAVCYVVSSALIFLDIRFNRNHLTKLYTAPLAYALLALLYLPFTFCLMLRFAVRPVSPKLVDELRALGMQDKHLLGSLYLCRDRRAKYLYSRFFFFRIKREENNERR